MKNYRKAAVALVMALALTKSVFAGEIHTGITPPDSQPTTTANGVMYTDGVIHTDGEMHTGEPAPATTGAITEAALTLLQSLLALI